MLISEIMHIQEYKLLFILNDEILGQASGLSLGLTCDFPIAKLVMPLSVVPALYFGGRWVTSKVLDFMGYSVDSEV